MHICITDHTLYIIFTHMDARIRATVYETSASRLVYRMFSGEVAVHWHVSAVAGVFFLPRWKSIATQRPKMAQCNALHTAKRPSSAILSKVDKRKWHKECDGEYEGNRNLGNFVSFGMFRAIIAYPLTFEKL